MRERGAGAVWLLATCAALFACDSKSADTSAVVTRKLAVSPSHACVIRSAGVYCWGDNFAGQLGTGAPTETTNATAVMASVVQSEVVEVAAATGRTCVRTRAGSVECWGMNDRGQAGDGTRSDTLVPVAAVDIDDAVALALDDESTCVIREAGRTVACWGGSRQDAWRARPVEGLTDIEELRAGSTGHYCARDARRVVWCWRSDDGLWATPVALPALAGARAVAVTSYDTVCALREAGDVVCHNTESGNTTALFDADDVVSINAAGSLALCGSKRDGSWACWNVLPTMLESVGSPAITVPSDVALTELWIAGFRVCALREDARVVCADANEVVIGLGSLAPNGLAPVQGLPDQGDEPRASSSPRTRGNASSTPDLRDVAAFRALSARPERELTRARAL
jgi:hypothetical protein